MNISLALRSRSVLALVTVVLCSLFSIPTFAFEHTIQLSQQGALSPVGNTAHKEVLIAQASQPFQLTQVNPQAPAKQQSLPPALMEALVSGQLNGLFGGMLGSGMAPQPQLPPIPPKRTFNQLSDKELGDLRKLEREYFFALRNEALRLQSASNEPINQLRSRIEILRQRHRARLDGIVSHLYALDLSDAFIADYVGRIREDVVDYCLDVLVNKQSTTSTPPQAQEEPVSQIPQE